MDTWPAVCLSQHPSLPEEAWSDVQSALFSRSIHSLHVHSVISLPILHLSPHLQSFQILAFIPCFSIFSLRPQWLNIAVVLPPAADQWASGVILVVQGDTCIGDTRAPGSSLRTGSEHTGFLFLPFLVVSRDGKPLSSISHVACLGIPPEVPVGCGGGGGSTGADVP